MIADNGSFSFYVGERLRGGRHTRAKGLWLVRGLMVLMGLNGVLIESTFTRGRLAHIDI